MRSPVLVPDPTRDRPGAQIQDLAGCLDRRRRLRNRVDEPQRQIPQLFQRGTGEQDPVDHHDQAAARMLFQQTAQLEGQARDLLVVTGQQAHRGLPQPALRRGDVWQILRPIPLRGALGLGQHQDAQPIGPVAQRQPPHQVVQRHRAPLRGSDHRQRPARGVDENRAEGLNRGIRHGFGQFLGAAQQVFAALRGPGGERPDGCRVGVCGVVRVVRIEVRCQWRGRVGAGGRARVEVRGVSRGGVLALGGSGLCRNRQDPVPFLPQQTRTPIGRNRPVPAQLRAGSDSSPTHRESRIFQGISPDGGLALMQRSGGAAGVEVGGRAVAR